MPFRLGVGRRAYLIPWPERASGAKSPPVPENLVPIIVTKETAKEYKFGGCMMHLLPQVPGETTFIVYTDHKTPLCIAQAYKDQFQVELLHAQP
jgi:hypothetical protein